MKIEPVAFVTICDVLFNLPLHVVDSSGEEYFHLNAFGDIVSAPEIRFSTHIWLHESPESELYENLLSELNKVRDGHTTFVFYSASTVQDSQKLSIEVVGSFITPKAQEYVPGS